jgi:hypothetical protein
MNDVYPPYIGPNKARKLLVHLTLFEAFCSQKIDACVQEGATRRSTPLSRANGQVRWCDCDAPQLCEVPENFLPRNASPIHLVYLRQVKLRRCTVHSLSDRLHCEYHTTCGACHTKCKMQA